MTQSIPAAEVVGVPHNHRQKCKCPRKDASAFLRVLEITKCSSNSILRALLPMPIASSDLTPESIRQISLQLYDNCKRQLRPYQRSEYSCFISCTVRMEKFVLVIILTIKKKKMKLFTLYLIYGSIAWAQITQVVDR